MMQGSARADLQHEVGEGDRDGGEGVRRVGHCQIREPQRTTCANTARTWYGASWERMGHAGAWRTRLERLVASEDKVPCAHHGRKEERRHQEGRAKGAPWVAVLLAQRSVNARHVDAHDGELFPGGGSGAL